MKLIVRNGVVLEKVLFFFFFILCITSFFDFDGYNVLPTSLLFELLFFFTVLLSFGPKNKKMIYLSFVSFGYFVYCYFLSLYNNINLTDYVVAYKFVLYFTVLPLFVNKSLLSEKTINSILWGLLVAFFLKYSINFYLSSNTRPGVFFENNYELCFLLILYFLDFTLRSNREDIRKTLFIVAILLLSGSRSALMSFVFIYVSILFISSTYVNARLVARLGMVITSIIIVFYIFVDRIPDGGIESIDRFVFLREFVFNLKDWDILTYFKGTPVLTPLSDATCRNLSFYSVLFSSDGTTCYSVVLHSFLLRVIYDHGLVGLFLVFFIINTLLKVKGFESKNRYVILGVVFLNSISVSAINSVFVMMGLLFCFISPLKSKECKVINGKLI